MAGKRKGSELVKESKDEERERDGEWWGMDVSSERGKVAW